jgi:hypothetical protein
MIRFPPPEWVPPDYEPRTVAQKISNDCIAVGAGSAQFSGLAHNWRVMVEHVALAKHA